MHSKDLHVPPHITKALLVAKEKEATQDFQVAAKLTSCVLCLENFQLKESKYHPEREILQKAHEFTSTLRTRRFSDESGKTERRHSQAYASSTSPKSADLHEHSIFPVCLDTPVLTTAHHVDQTEQINKNIYQDSKGNCIRINSTRPREWHW